MGFINVGKSLLLSLRPVEQTGNLQSHHISAGKKSAVLATLGISLVAVGAFAAPYSWRPRIWPLAVPVAAPEVTEPKAAQNTPIVAANSNSSNNVQADLWIKNAGETTWAGQNIYNAHGSVQVKEQQVPRGGTAVYILTLQNDGTVADSYHVTGPKSHTGWQVRYYDAPSGGNEITTQVTKNPGWASPTLNPGQSIELRFEVYAEPSGHSPHDENMIKAVSRSGKGNAGVDQVKTETSIVAAPTPTATPEPTPTPNRAPVAQGNSYTLDEDQRLNVTPPGLLGNDSDPDADTLRAELVGSPSQGVLLQFGADGSFIYAPNANYTGADSFTYKVTDGELWSQTVTVDITVNPVNDVPVAVADTYETAEDTSLSVPAPGLKVNDTDAENSTLTVIRASDPAHGTLSAFGEDGSFTYVPNVNYTGTDSFTYYVSDGTANSLPVTAAIQVTPVNDAPCANPQDLETAEETPLEITLTGSDTELTTLTFRVVAPPGHGTVSEVNGGVLTYTPELNFTGTDFFFVRSNDGQADSGDTRINIQVMPVNDAPTATDDFLGTPEDTNLTLQPATLLNNDNDVDGDTLSVQIVTEPANGTLQRGANGDFVYVPNGQFNGPDTFTYQAKDPSGSLSNLATVTIAVNSTPDAPVALADQYSTDEDTALTISAPGVLDNDSSPDGVTFTAVKVTDPGHGTLTLNANGGFTYAPEGNYAGTDSFTYLARDAAGLESAPVTVSLTIAAVNDAPVAEEDDEVSTQEDTAVPVNLVASDVENEALTYIITRPPVHGTLTGTAPNFTYTPEPDFHGTDSVQFLVNDGQADSNEATVVIEIGTVNDVPTAASEDLIAREDTARVIQLRAQDADGDTLVYTLRSLPGHGVLSINGNEITAFPHNLSGTELTYTPSANYHGSDTFTFQVNDGTVDSALATINLDVQPVNDAPTADDKTVETDEDTAVPVELSGHDEENQTLVYTVILPPGHGTLTGTGANLTYTPAANYHGTDSFRYLVNDGGANSEPVTVSITIQPVNDVPVAAAGNYTIDEDTPREVSAADGVLKHATDADGQELTAELVNAPASGELTFHPDGSFLYVPSANFAGEVTFSYVAKDGGSTSQPAVVTLTVQAFPDAPAAVDQTLTTPEDTELPLTLSASDAENDTLTFRVIAEPEHGTLTGTAPNLIYTPAANYSGPDFFLFKANDGTADSNVGRIAITVTPVNDAPVAVNDATGTDEDTPVNLTFTWLLQNDTDPEGGALTVELVSDPEHGTLERVSTGYRYVPAEDYSGTDSFTYRARDNGGLLSNVAAVTLTINGTVDAPRATEDFYATAEEQAIAVEAPGVLGNDSSPDGLAIHAVKVTDPGHGTVTLNTDGSFEYTPATNFRGTDSFTYKAVDAEDRASEPVTVSIRVVNLNDVPVAQDQELTTPEEKPVPIVLGATDGDNDALTYRIVTAPAHGALTGTAPQLTYTPAKDFVGDDVIAFSAHDGRAESGVGTITIHVTNTNDAPVAVNDAYNTTEDTTLNVTQGGLLANDSDPDGDTLAAELLDGPRLGVLELRPNGTFIYTPRANANGTDTFTYRVSDGDLISAPATVTVTMGAVNEAPVATGQKLTTREDTPRSVVLSAVEPDSEALTFEVVMAPEHGTLSGTAPQLVYTPNANYHGTDRFTFRASDPGGLQSNLAEIQITVTPVNDAPVARPDYYSLDEGETLAVTEGGVLANDSDPDGGVLTATVGQQPEHGTLTLNSNGTFVYEPEAEYSGQDSFTYTVRDSSGATASALVQLLIRGENDAPVAVDDTATGAGTGLDIPVVNNDSDKETPRSELRVTAVTAGSAGGNAAVLTGGQVIRYTPRVGFMGEEHFTYTLSDGELTDTAQVTISMTEPLPPDSRGTEYWLAFPGNGSDGESFTNENIGKCRITLSSQTAAQVVVAVPALGFLRSVSLSAGGNADVDLPRAVMLNDYDGITNKAVHVTSDRPISVYALNLHFWESDGYLGLPVTALGTDYRVMAFVPSVPPFGPPVSVFPSQITCVGTEDGTVVTITPASTGVPAGGQAAKAAGVPFNVTLNRGQTYQLRSNGDLTGSRVTATKPITVLGGNRLTPVPAGYGYANHLVEQMLPTSAWGTEFYSMPLADRANGDTFRFLSNTDGTVVSVNGNVVATLNAGQFHERRIGTVALITSSQPILVAQYANSGGYDNKAADPFMSLVPAVNHYAPAYTVTTPAPWVDTDDDNNVYARKFTRNYVHLMVPTAALSTLRKDGQTLTATPVAIPGTAYSAVQISLTDGPHTFTSTNNTDFGLNIYGTDTWDGYGYPGALGKSPVVVPTDPTPTPTPSGPDTTEPTVQIRYPVDAAAVRNLQWISGTAEDEGGSTLDNVTLRIQRQSDSLYWTGTAWGAETELGTERSGAFWYRDEDLPSEAQLPEGYYELRATAKDKAGNLARHTITILVDRTAPQVAWTQPMDGEVLEVFPHLTGTAGDLVATGAPAHVEPSGVAKVELLISVLVEGTPIYWSGSQWGLDATWIPATLSGTTGTIDWSRLDPPFGSNLLTGEYSLSARAVDRAGNEAVSTIAVQIVPPPAIEPYEFSGRIDARSFGVGLGTQPNQAGIYNGTYDPQGEVTVSGLPAGARIERAYVYTSQTARFSQAVDHNALLRFGNPGLEREVWPRLSVMHDDGLSNVLKWDVTGLVHGNGKFNFDVEIELSAVHALSLLVVYSHPSLPSAEVRIRDGLTGGGHHAWTSSAQWDNVGAGPGHLLLFYTADNGPQQADQTGEVISWNGRRISGPIDCNLGPGGSLFDLPLTTQDGTNTVSTSSVADSILWPYAVLVAQGGIGSDPDPTPTTTATPTGTPDPGSTPTPTPTARPDLQVQGTETEFVGEDIYSQDGADQTSTQIVATGQTATYKLRLQNDGTAHDILQLRLPENHSGWTLRLYDSVEGGTEITESAQGEGWSTPELAPGAGRDLRLEVVPAAGLVSGSQITAEIHLYSNLSSSVRDAVRTITAINFLPGTPGAEITLDALINSNTEPEFIGENIVNSTGEGQTKQVSTRSDRSATFGVVLANGSDRPRAFRVTGLTGAEGWRVRYLSPGANHNWAQPQDITAQVTGTGWTSEPQPAADGQTPALQIRVQVIPPEAVAVGTLQELPIKVAFADELSISDTVKAIVERAADPEPTPTATASATPTATASATPTATASATPTATASATPTATATAEPEPTPDLPRAPSVDVKPEDDTTYGEVVAVTVDYVDAAPAGSIIYYSLDGSDPTPDSLRYNGTFFLASTTTVTARAYAPGCLPGLPDAESYTLGAAPDEVPNQTVAIRSPGDGAELTQPTAVKINVPGNSGANALVGWQVGYRMLDGEDVGSYSNGQAYYQLISRGTAAMADADTPQKFDPTLLLNGLFRLKLEAFYADGTTAQDFKDVVVKGGMKIGHFSMSFNDMTLPVAGIPISITRTYDSRDTRKGDFGIGWSLSTADVRLQKNGPVGGSDRFNVWSVSRRSGFGTFTPQFNVLKPRIVTITMPDGQVHSFRAVASGPTQITSVMYGNLNWVAQPGTKGKLTAVGSNEVFAQNGSTMLYEDEFMDRAYNPTKWLLTLPNGTKIYLEEQGDISVGGKARILYIEELAGNRLIFGENGIRTEAHDGTVTRSVSFERDAQTGFITSITDARGFKTTYQQDSKGNLHVFKDREGNPTSFEYDNPAYAHYVSGIKDARQIRVSRIYYTEDGRVDYTLDADGKKIDQDHDLAQHLETTTDRRGYRTQFKYDSFGNVTETRRELRDTNNNFLHWVTTKSTYDLSGPNPELPVTTSSFGEVYSPVTDTTLVQELVTKYEYNSSGSLTKVTDPNGHSTETTYDNNQQVLSLKDAKGKVILQNSYYTAPRDVDGNPQGALRSTTDANNNTTTYTYYGNGAPRTVKDPLGRVTSYSLDWGTGNISSETNPSNTVTFTYNNNGDKKTQSVTRTKADGSTATLTTAYEHDKEGRITQTTLPGNVMSKTVYLPTGKVLSCTTMYGTPQSRITSFEYDDMGRRTKTTYQDGSFTHITYNNNDQLEVSYDRVGRGTKRIYDSLGRLISTQYVSPNGDTINGKNSEPVQSFTEYDDSGRVLKSRNSYGAEIYLSYDKTGNLVKKKNSLGESTSLVYDNTNLMTSSVDARGKTSSYAYDDSGRLYEVAQSDGTKTQTLYDVLNRTVYSYTEGRPGEAVNGVRPKYDAKRHVYDMRGNLAAIIQNTKGEPSEDGTSQDDLVTRFGYDELGQKIWQQDAKGYIEDGRPGLFITPEHRVTRFEYDERGFLIYRETPLGQTERMTYWPTGELKSYTDFRSYTTTHTYDARGRMLSKTPDSRLNEPAIVYEYLDELTKVQRRGAVTIIYRYDANRGWLKEVDGPNGGLRYEYDDAGNKTKVKQLTENSVFEIEYGYDELSRLKTISQNGQVLASIGYDAVGNRERVTRLNGVNSTYIYDSLNRLDTLTHMRGGTPLAFYDYNVRGDGKRDGVEETLVNADEVNNAARLTNRNVAFSYDGNGRLTRETGQDGAGVGYRSTWSYDAAGNRTSTLYEKAASAEATTYAHNTSIRAVFNANDWLTSQTTTVDGGTPSTTTWTYDDNGAEKTVTLESGTTTTNTWGFEGQLLGTDGNTDTANVYDAEGHRVQQSVTSGADTTVTKYVVDPNTSYAQVVQERDGSNVLQARYIWEDSLAPLVMLRKQEDGSFKAFYYLTDGQDSVRQLTDNNGLVTDSYHYDAWGNALSGGSGNTKNPFRYTGQQLDADGKYFLRARYYTPGTGRFLGHDPLHGTKFKPISLHRYLYASDDAVNFTDPSGLESVAETQTSIQAQLQIASNYTKNILTIYNRVNSAKEFYESFEGMYKLIMQQPTLKELLRQSFDNAKDLFTDSKNGPKMFTLEAVLEDLDKNMPRLVQGMALWSGELVSTWGKVKDFAIYTPNPVSGLPFFRIQLPNIPKLDKGIALRFGYGGKAGRVIGMGIERGRGQNDDEQIWRMDFHVMHEYKTGSDELDSWQSKHNKQFHYHILMPGRRGGGDE